YLSSISLHDALPILRNARRYWLAAFLGILLAAGPTSACAEKGELEEAMALFAAQKFNQTVSAIDHVVASGAPQAYAIIEALANRDRKSTRLNSSHVK